MNIINWLRGMLCPEMGQLSKEMEDLRTKWNICGVEKLSLKEDLDKCNTEGEALRGENEILKASILDAMTQYLNSKFSKVNLIYSKKEGS
jgi:hypothetical protein